MSDEPQSLFGSKTLTIGDVEYTVNELDGGTYDQCVELARVEVDAAHPMGLDAHLQLIFMAERAVTPKLSLADINKLPFTKRGQLFDAVNEVHYGTPPKPVAPDESKDKSVGG